MVVLGRFALSLVAVGLMVLGVAAPAGATGMTVSAAIKAQDHAVRQSPALKKLLRHSVANTPAEAKKLIPELQALHKKLEQAANAVAGATATTSKQKTGQKDWGRRRS